MPKKFDNIDDLTKHIIGAAYRVYNALGFGFLESVYEKSLMIELKKLSINAHSQKPVKVYYDGHIVGDFYADILVDEQVIVELKSVAQLNTAHEVQVVNYLHATQVENGLLINFGPEKVEVKRKYKTYKRIRQD